MVSAPLMGELVGRWPLRRSVLVFAIVLVTAAAWTVVLAWPGPAPYPLLVVLVLVLGTNGPASAIGFDYARTENPAERLGSANGFVNVGGFMASLLSILVIGVILDLLTRGASTAYSLDAFRAAFSVQYVFWLVGALGVLRYRRALRARLADEGVHIAPLHRAISHRLRGSSAYK
jgi:MFS family permease